MRCMLRMGRDLIAQREPREIDSNFNFYFQKVLPNRGFEHPTLSC